MGSYARARPTHIGRKLRAIRDNLRWTQTQMADHLKLVEPRIRRSDISRFELGVREPALLVMLAYARVGKTSMERLVDDQIE